MNFESIGRCRFFVVMSVFECGSWGGRWFSLVDGPIVWDKKAVGVSSW
jgi:hypothetical protein